MKNRGLTTTHRNRDTGLPVRLVASAAAIALVLGAAVPAWAAINNTATANGTPAGGTLVPPTDSESVDVIDASSSLTISKSVTSLTTTNGTDSNDPDAGDIITYSYTVTNTGNVTVNGVAPTDAGPTFDSNAASNTLSAFLPATANLAPGASQVFVATYTLTQADVDNAAGVANGVSNTASATGTPASGVLAPVTPSTATTTIPAAPDMTIVKTADATSLLGNVPVGHVITYTYTVTNTGNVTIANVAIGDVHNGTGTAPVPGGEVLATDNGTAGDSVDAAANGTWDTFGPGDVITFTATYTVTQTDVDTLQ